MRTLKPYLERIALETGILPGRQDYCKFIILSRSRSGSQYLRSFLNSHSQINVFGELFKQKDQITWHYPDHYHSRKQQATFQKNPVLFIQKEIFRTYPKRIKAVGFKIFYYHAQDDHWKSIWTYLQNQMDLKIIHLKRKNILEAHLSRKRANDSGKWINLTGEREEVKPVTIEYEECLRDFIITRKWEKQYASFFKNHLSLDVFYESLSNDSYMELRHIQKFLGVEEEDLKSATHKQTAKSISKVIANYFELKEQFKDTEWAEFFEA